MRTACAICTIIMITALAACKQATDNTTNLHDNATRESFYEWYIEILDSGGNSREVRYFNSDGSLKEYMVLHYDGNGNNDNVKIYSSDTVTDASTLLGEFVYVYDTNGDCVSGTLSRKIGGTMTTQQNFTASYNSQHNYLDCKLMAGAGTTVIEHRVCSYDGSGENYVDEKYYSDATELPDKLVESYHCIYDPTDAWRWTREDHYVKLSADDPNDGYVSYESYMIHTFTWNGDNMYLQSDFKSDATWAKGQMISAIMYTFNAKGKALTRSSFNQDGELQYRRTYQYDSSDRRTQTSVFNYNNDSGQELDSRIVETYFATTTGGTATDMHDRKIYTYSYASRSIGLDGNATGGLGVPVSRHHLGG